MKGILEAIKLAKMLGEEEMNSRLVKALENRNKRDKHSEEFEIYLPTEELTSELDIELNFEYKTQVVNKLYDPVLKVTKEDYLNLAA